MTLDDTHSQPPLYVDLDGTLIAGDTLWESVAILARQRPLDLLRIPGWIAGGRAAFKRAVAERVLPAPNDLAYRPEVLDLVRKTREGGRRVVLASASDAQVVRAVADHVGGFDGVLASDGQKNLKGAAKADAIEADAGGPFDYAGDSPADLPIWARADRALLVAASPRTTRAARALGVPVETVVASPALGPVVLRALRPHQWLKNALLFVPLVLDHNFEPARIAACVAAFACFCLCISATYLVNDFVDVAADRRHPTKRNRPFASGALPIPVGLAAAGLLLVSGLGFSMLTLSWAATGMLAAYVALTLSYSFFFKQQLVLDVLVLGGLYTHRVVAGGVAADVLVSPWLLAFSMFFFVSLAFLKRYIELLSAQSREIDTLSGRRYQTGDVGLVESMGLTSGYLSVLVIGLYVSSDKVVSMYATPELLWFICPVMLYWLTRVWFLARRGQLPDDPVWFAATDRASYVSVTLVGAVLVAAAFVGSPGG